MLIRNYGLFWKEEDVFWGEGGKGNKGEGENHPIPITTWMCVIADWWVDRQPTPSRAKGLAFERMRLD